MSDEHDEALVLRGVAYRMSLGIETKTHKHVLRAFRNTFLGTVRYLRTAVLRLFTSDTYGGTTVLCLLLLVRFVVQISARGQSIVPTATAVCTCTSLNYTAVLLVLLVVFFLLLCI